MQTQIIDLVGAAPGVRHSLTVLHFGRPGQGPKATLQAALHADEVPAMLVAHHLRGLLLALEAGGQLNGHVQLVPQANPLGLAQQVLGQHQGRFALADGLNFNRGHADLTEAVVARVQGRLNADEAHNLRLIRSALREAATALPAATPAQDLKRRLVQLAIDSDIVLDLHCDSEAVMHLYALAAQAPLAGELGALLGARALLLADDSGDGPFDEACSRPWLLLRQRLAEHPIPLACFSATVELRGEADTHHALAQRDALAIIEFLRRRGVVAGPATALPPSLCQATPLAGSEPVVAPRAGVLVYRVEPGCSVREGDTVAELVDVASGTTEPLCARAGGVLYARLATRWAAPGQRVAKIAGTTLARTGKLLSP